ncbi:MAG: hypothetical protein KBB83_08180 [Alphaproteobacteria bacterium]|nr:hypothetical protein [Alphaproteobacteria bacterium]
MNKAKLYFTAVLLSTSAMASNSDDFNNNNNKRTPIGAPAAEASVTVVDMDQLLQARVGIERQVQEVRRNYDKHETLSAQLLDLLMKQLSLESVTLSQKNWLDMYKKDSISPGLPLDELEKLKRLQEITQDAIYRCEAKLLENKSIIEMLVKVIDEDPPELPPAVLKLFSSTRLDLAKMRASVEEDLKTRHKKSYWYQEVIRITKIVDTRLRMLNDRHVMLQNKLDKSRSQELELLCQTNTVRAAQRYAH